MKRVALIAWGSFIVAWGLAVLVVGQYHYGKGPKALLITETDNPQAFWAAVVGAVTIGAAAILYAIKKVPRDRLISPEELEK